MKERLKNQKLLRLNRNMKQKHTKTWHRCPWPCPAHFLRESSNRKKKLRSLSFVDQVPIAEAPICVAPKIPSGDVMESKPVARVESQATCAERVEGSRRQWPKKVRRCQNRQKLSFLIQTICQSTSKTRHSGANSWKLSNLFDMTRIPSLLMSWPGVITFFAAKDMGIEGSISLHL